MRPSGWTLTQSDQCPYKKRRLGHTERHQRYRGKPCGEASTGQPSANQGESPQRKWNCWHLDLDFQPPELGENLLLFMLPSLCYFVIAALANWYTPLLRTNNFHISGQQEAVAWLKRSPWSLYEPGNLCFVRQGCIFSQQDLAAVPGTQERASHFLRKEVSLVAQTPPPPSPRKSPARRGESCFVILQRKHRWHLGYRKL